MNIFLSIKKNNNRPLNYAPVCWHEYWFFEGSKDYVRLSNLYSLYGVRWTHVRGIRVKQKHVKIQFALFAKPYVNL